MYLSSAGFDHKRAQEAQVQILVKLCTQVLQDLTTRRAQEVQVADFGQIVYSNSTGFDHTRAQEALVQILLKLCTQVLEDLTTDVPRKPRCRFWSNCVLKFCRI